MVTYPIHGRPGYGWVSLKNSHWLIVTLVHETRRQSTKKRISNNKPLLTYVNNNHSARESHLTRNNNKSKKKRKEKQRHVINFPRPPLNKHGTHKQTQNSSLAARKMRKICDCWTNFFFFFKQKTKKKERAWAELERSVPEWVEERTGNEGRLVGLDRPKRGACWRKKKPPPLLSFSSYSLVALLEQTASPSPSSLFSLSSALHAYIALVWPASLSCL